MTRPITEILRDAEVTEPSDPPQLLLGCTGKAGFDTYDSAAAVVERMPKRNKRGRCVIPYRCRHCGKWHVGGK